jgi:hypothetical protein
MHDDEVEAAADEVPETGVPDDEVDAEGFPETATPDCDVDKVPDAVTLDVTPAALADDVGTTAVGVLDGSALLEATAVVSIQ